MHIPDGFIDAEHLRRCGHRRRGRRGGVPEEGGRHDAGEASCDGRPGLRVHLRGADAQLPRRERHQRPSPRRPPRGGARRPMGRFALRQRRAVRPSIGVRRRRLERARAERHQHGARHRARSVTSSSARLRMRAAAHQGRCRGRVRGRRVLVRRARVARVHPRVRGRRDGWRIGCQPCSAPWSACTRADRYRRGRHHRSHRGGGARGSSRPRVRRRPTSSRSWSSAPAWPRPRRCRGSRDEQRSVVPGWWCSQSVRSSSRCSSPPSRARSRARSPTGSTRSPSTRASDNKATASAVGRRPARRATRSRTCRTRR